MTRKHNKLRMEKDNGEVEERKEGRMGQRNGMEEGIQMGQALSSVTVCE